ncbi:hypothetical protein D6D01_06232 [Aureobasidium pullulans]|uniref:Uncharacterized protein n=1 Tax=Aureobasidium pullulans TaxID=5580 RepID=A0A4S9L2J5_AURPU|nr:hypothetical protein D6D01_06232 [Aureobasidium pullulans]
MDIFKDESLLPPPSTTCPEERYNPEQWLELYATLPPPRPVEQGMLAPHGYTSTELNATDSGAASLSGMDDGHLDTAMHGYGIPSSTPQQIYNPFYPIHHQRQPPPQFGNPNDEYGIPHPAYARYQASYMPNNSCAPRPASQVHQAHFQEATCAPRPASEVYKAHFQQAKNIHPRSKTEVEKETETKTECRFDTIFDIKSLALIPAQDRLRQARQETEEKAPKYLPVSRHEQDIPPTQTAQRPHNGFSPKSAAELIRERSRKKKALPIVNKRSPDLTKIHPSVQNYYDIIDRDMHPNDHYTSEQNAMSKDQIIQRHEIEYQERLESSRRALKKRKQVDSDEKISPPAPQAAESKLLPASPQQAMDDKNKGVSKPIGRVPTQQELYQSQEQLILQQRAILEDKQHVYPILPASLQVGPFYAAESNFLPVPTQQAIDNMNKCISKPPGRVPTQQQLYQIQEQMILQQRAILQDNPRIYGKPPPSPWVPSDTAESKAAVSTKEKAEASKKEKAKAKVECAAAAAATAQNPQQNELNRPLDEPEQMDWEVKTRAFYKSGPRLEPAFSSEERDKQLTRFFDFADDGSDSDFEDEENSGWEDEEEGAVTRMRAQVAQVVQARVSSDDFSSDEETTLPKVPLNDDDSGDETSFDEAEILYGEDVDVVMRDLSDSEEEVEVDEEGEWMLV